MKTRSFLLGTGRETRYNYVLISQSQVPILTTASRNSRDERTCEKRLVPCVASPDSGLGTRPALNPITVSSVASGFDRKQLR
jgi:hypothetical protein